MIDAIRIEGLSKRYLISHRAERPFTRTLGKSAIGLANGLARRLRDMFERTPRASEKDEFWALKDIIFEYRSAARWSASSAATARASRRC